MNATQTMMPMNRQRAIRLQKGQRDWELRARREADKQRRVMQELKTAKLGWYGMLQPEPRAVATLIRDWEHVVGAVYGYSPEGFALLTATDSRILFVSKKFVFTQVDEIPFHSVEGVSIETIGPFATITLHAKFGDFVIRTINFACAVNFVNYIDSKIEERKESNVATQEVYV